MTRWLFRPITVPVFFQAVVGGILLLNVLKEVPGQPLYTIIRLTATLMFGWFVYWLATRHWAIRPARSSNTDPTPVLERWRNIRWPWLMAAALAVWAAVVLARFIVQLMQ